MVGGPRRGSGIMAHLRRLRRPAAEPVAILGMHRSGTSSLAGSLEAHGLAFGDVVRQAPYNRRGNLEDLRIRALHDAVLEDSGGAWDAPPATTRWTPGREAELTEIVSAYRPLGVWGFKDPRSLLVLDGWLRELPALRLVGTYRHPAAVARSLRARHPSMTADHAEGLWLHYNELLLRTSQEHHVRLVCFDLPGDAYEARVAQLAAALGLGPRHAAGFFTAELRHWSPGEWKWTSGKARDVYQQLEKLARRL